MFLYDLFPPDLIVTNLIAADKKEVFREMAGRFCQTMKNCTVEGILEALWDRESRMTTGIQKGIAIPHGKTGVLDRTCGILGISQKGIAYNSLDGHPVHLIFMIIGPASDSDEYLEILKRLLLLLGFP